MRVLPQPDFWRFHFWKLLLPAKISLPDCHQVLGETLVRLQSGSGDFPPNCTTLGWTQTCKRTWENYNRQIEKPQKTTYVHILSSVLDAYHFLYTGVWYTFFSENITGVKSSEIFLMALKFYFKRQQPLRWIFNGPFYDRQTHSDSKFLPRLIRDACSLSRPAIRIISTLN